MYVAVDRAANIAMMSPYLSHIFLALLCLCGAASSQSETKTDEIKEIRAELEELQKLLHTTVRRVGKSIHKQCALTILF